MRGSAISLLTRASVALSDSFLGFLSVFISTLKSSGDALLTLSDIMIERVKAQVCPILLRCLGPSK
jgi:hypothetical protein